MRILCLVPALPEDLNDKCIASILSQTLPISMLVILPERIKGGTLPEKVSRALNNGLASLKIGNFDYILRVNGDTVLPSNFLEENLKDSPDLCGHTGDANIIKVEPFLELLNGRFPQKSDDTYINFKFHLSGFKVTRYGAPILTRRINGATHGLRYFWNRGTYLYQLGLEPIHFIADMIRDVTGDRRNALCIGGYVSAVLKRVEKFDLAQIVWSYQTRRLFFGKKYALQAAIRENRQLMPRLTQRVPN